MGRNIRVCPGIQLQAVKSEALGAQWYLCQLGPNLGVELVPVHAHIAGCIAVANESGQYMNTHGWLRSPKDRSGFATGGLINQIQIPSRLEPVNTSS